MIHVYNGSQWQLHTLVFVYPWLAEHCIDLYAFQIMDLSMIEICLQIATDKISKALEVWTML